MLSRQSASDPDGSKQEKHGMGIYDRDYYQAEQLSPLRPWDNKSMVTLLIIANLALYVANFLFSSSSNALTTTLALDSQSLWKPALWWQLLTYGFVHDPRRITHILFNMVSLYFLGRQVEERLGKWEFFRFYMLSIIICGAVWCGIHGEENLDLYGASGATTAVTMLFVFYYPQANLLLMMAFPVKAWVVGVLVIVNNLFMPMTSDGSIAYDVHLVGAALAAGYFFGGWNFGVLGTLFGNAQSMVKQKRSGLKVHRPDRDADEPSKDDIELDRILDKIHREGQDSLTSREQKFMERYSRQVRRRREQ